MAHPDSTAAKEGRPEGLGHDPQEAEDEDTGPGVEDGEDRVEVEGLLVRIPDVGREGEPPGHAEDEGEHEQPGSLEVVLGSRGISVPAL